MCHRGRSALAITGFVLAGCTVGSGAGEVRLTVSLPACELDNEVIDLDPTFFAAQAIEHTTMIRIQRGGEIERFSDGLVVRVADATEVARTGLGMPLEAGIADDVIAHVYPVSGALYLNARCDARGTASIPATGGFVTFDSIYAPKDDDDQRLVEGELALDFSDPERPDRVRATASGWFRFFYARGRPAQAFP